MILHFAVFLEPSFVVAVMVTDPDETAVTAPFPSTVAIFLFDDFQFTVLIDAFVGAIFAASFSVFPRFIFACVLLSFTDFTGRIFTETEHLADMDGFPLSLAVTIVFPFAIPVTFPLASTFAIPGFEDVHCTADAGTPATDSLIAPGSVTNAVLLFRRIDLIFDASKIGVPVECELPAVAEIPTDEFPVETDELTPTLCPTPFSSI